MAPVSRSLLNVHVLVLATIASIPAAVAQGTSSSSSSDNVKMIIDNAFHTIPEPFERLQHDVSSITFPTDYDVQQCTARKLLKSGAFLLSDLDHEGCALQDEKAFQIYNTVNGKTVGTTPFQQAQWVVEIKRASKNDSVLTAVSPSKKPVCYCYSLGHLGMSGYHGAAAKPEQPPEVVPDEQTDEVAVAAVHVDNAEDPNEALFHFNFTLERAFVRKAVITDKKNDRLLRRRIDKKFMSYYLVVRNVPNPYENVEFPEDLSFIQMVEIAWFDENGNALSATNTAEADSTESFDWGGDVPQRARSVSLTFMSNNPFYAVGQISLIVYPSRLDNVEDAHRLFDVFFWIGFGFVVLCPPILLLEDIYRKRRISLRMVDLVHSQGPRYVRALIFTVMMALLYFMFQWMSAKRPDDDGGLIPLFNGIPAGLFAGKQELKKWKSAIFIASFLAVGILFWPLFVCYAHSADGSRTASILGTLAAVNLIGLRFCLQYANAVPYKSYDRHVVQELPEVLCYVAIVGYFLTHAAHPTFIATKYRKSFFADLIYVRSLLGKVQISAEPAPEQPTTFLARLKMAIKEGIKRLKPVDNRPIWLRGRKNNVSISQQIKIFFTTLRTPVRLMAAVMMMCLFTYFVLIAQLYKLIDINARLSCQLGMYTDFLIDMFAITSQLIGDFTGAHSFGAPLAETIRDLSSQIRNETRSGAAEILYNLLLWSIVASMVISALLLVFNIVDFCMVVRADMQKLRKGDYSRIERYDKTATSMAMQFMGIQIGYAYIDIMTILLIITFMLALFVRFRFFRELFVRFILQNWLVFAAFVFAIVLEKAQRFVVDTFFVAKLREKPSQHPDAENAVVDKRDVVISTKYWLKRTVLFNQIDYFFLFPNLINGLLSFLSNLLKLILGSALFAYRLDKQVGGITIAALGTKSGVYHSWLLQEHHHSNPVLLIFIKLLSDWETYNRLPGSPARTNKDLRAARIRTRWAVLYTLVNNPSLAKFRKHVVRETYLKEYIANTSEPLLRELELQRVRAENARLAEGRGKLRERELAIWKRATEGGFGRQALAKKVKMDNAKNKKAGVDGFPVPGSAFDYDPNKPPRTVTSIPSPQDFTWENSMVSTEATKNDVETVSVAVTRTLPADEPFLQSTDSENPYEIEKPLSVGRERLTEGQ
ncbi:hypothetical protein HDU96_008695 [Phlyctochytrium bullatum]|nr:hypothetical protein HDU96_008695 [Phlyctochytrium bullatum]